jgi:hypothetical protein
MRYGYFGTTVGVSILALFAGLSLGQMAPHASPTPVTIRPPGNVQLLDGYVYERRRGIDSHVGSMVRHDGFQIKHDIGRMAANYADQYFPEYFERLRKQTHLNSDAIETEIKIRRDKVEWRQRQKVNGDDVMVVLLKDSTLIASFVNSYANFIAKADTSDKIAEFFLIVLTYQPDLNKRN